MLRPFTRIAFLLLACFATLGAWAQLPQCLSPTSGYIYYMGSGNQIVNYDPFSPLSAANPFLNTITTPSGAAGLAVSSNINGGPTSPTFYTTVNGVFWWYNGTTNTWVNTGHSTSNGAAVNIGAGGGYIYNLVGASGQVYRYDGTGPAVLIATVAGFNGGGPYDLTADCQGNWYILCTSPTTNQYLRKYSPAGTLLQSWTLTGAPSTSAGGGMGIVGNTLVYYHNGANPLVTGNIGATTVTMNPGVSITNGFTFASDYASCPLGGLSAVFASIDTGYYCGTGPGIPVSASGPPNYVWTVISGNAVVAGSGANVTITATSGISKIVLSTTDTSASTSCGGSLTDTVTIIVPSGLAEAGPNDTLLGCATYTGTLNGIFTNGTPGLTYNITWTPAATITAGANTLTPTIAPTAQTKYFLNVFTIPAQGSCLFRDSVTISVQDISVDANYSYNIKYGCDQDTVVFTNTSTQATTGFSPMTYRWEFGDGTNDTAKNPTHIYPNQGVYAVKLVTRNTQCRDSIQQSIDLQHPLEASFTQDADSFCQGGTVTFTNTSTTTTRLGIGPKYFWTFGDGGTDTVASPTHTYTRAGVWPVTLIVTDFVPCVDTARDTVVIDSIPFVRIAISDSSLCEGQAITFTGDYLKENNTGIRWNFGDGTGVENTNPATHGYDEPGTYNVTLTASYRICPDTTIGREITIRPFSPVNLGPDTSICPGGEPILITARLGGTPADGAQVRWSTGDTASSILVRHHGTYWAVADRDGCLSSDSIYVAKDCYLDIPNVFSPNNDGTNDFFLPRQLLSEGVVRFTMNIYNRWGQKIWETTRIDGRGWDGKFNGTDQPTGVYIYLIEAEFQNGYREKYQGNVTLLR